jgi:hypothetical protein
MSLIAKKFFIASLVYLILGLLFQAVIGFDVWLGFNPLAYTTTTAIMQTLLLGWLTQLGLAFVYDRWLTPAQRELKSPAKAPNSQAAMVVFVLFNIGLPLVIVGQPGLALFGGRWLGAVTALAGLLPLFAGLVFVADVWRLLRSKR